MNAVRGTRVLRGVSSPRSDSVDSATLCVNAAGCDAHYPTSLHASTPKDRACSSEDFGERRANANDDATWPQPPQFGFGAAEIIGGQGRETRD